MRKEQIKFKEVKREAKTVPEIGIGVLGYGFVSKAHCHAWWNIPLFYWPPPATPRLIAVCGRKEKVVQEAARRYRFFGYYTDWKDMVQDQRIEIFDNTGPNNIHAGPTIVAAEAGKHVICEKPLSNSVADSKRMLEVVSKEQVKHMCGYNYRFVPAIRLAKKLIDEGRIGRIYHFRARYLQEWLNDPQLPLLWRMKKEIAGSGPLGDLGSHIIDLARFLVGEIERVTGVTADFIEMRTLKGEPARKGRVTVEDAFEATVEFQNGAIGTLEATGFATGRKNYNNFEISGERGSIEFNLERLNELRVYLKDEEIEDIAGWHEILVTESYHPLINSIYWPEGHIIGWEHTFINELHYFLDCVVGDKPLEPYAATFEDGYKVDVVCDAICKSALTGKKVTVNY